MGFASARATLIFLLGETREELSGSEWAWVDARAPRRPAAAGRPRRASGLAELMAEAARAGHRPLGARPVRRRPGPGAGRVVPAARRRRHGSRCRTSDGRAVRLAVQRVDRPGAGGRAPRAREGVHRTLRRAWRAVDADRGHRPRRRRDRGAGPVHDRPATNCGRRSLRRCRSSSVALPRPTRSPGPARRRSRRSVRTIRRRRRRRRHPARTAVPTSPPFSPTRCR